MVSGDNKRKTSGIGRILAMQTKSTIRIIAILFLSCFFGFALTGTRSLAQEFSVDFSVPHRLGALMVTFPDHFKHFDPHLSGIEELRGLDHQKVSSLINKVAYPPSKISMVAENTLFIQFPNDIIAYDFARVALNHGLVVEPDILITLPPFNIEEAGLNAQQSAWWLEQINVQSAHNAGANGANTIVATLGSGVEITHPGLENIIWKNTGETSQTDNIDDDGNGYIDDYYGWNGIDDNGDVRDTIGHETFVTGIIAQTAPYTKSIALKFIGESGSGYLSDAVKCLTYLRRNLRRAPFQNLVAVNMSFGSDSSSASMLSRIHSLGLRGVLFAVSSGNTARNNDTKPYYPSQYAVTEDSVISVLATYLRDRIAGFSSWGFTSVSMGAPGQNILSTAMGGGYGYGSGTSFSAPFVTGAAAVVASYFLAQDKILSAREKKQRILWSSDLIKRYLSGKCVTEGRLNIGNAIRDNLALPSAVTVQIQEVTLQKATVLILLNEAVRTIEYGKAGRRERFFKNPGDRTEITLTIDGNFSEPQSYAFTGVNAIGERGETTEVILSLP